MKNSTKLLIVAIALLMAGVQTSAQDAVGMRIDVKGTRFADQMWVFADLYSTRGFDNGYDGYKMFGTNSLAPQIFGMEAEGNFQVDAVPDLNNTYIAFKAGEDKQYTLTFTSQNLGNYYQQVLLVDSVANKTIDIFNTGVTYTFAVEPTAAPVRRFKIITVLPAPPVVVVPPTPVDTVVVPPVVVVPPAPVDTVVIVVPPVVVVPPAPVDTVVVPVIPPVVVVPPVPVVSTPPVVVPKDKKDKKDNKDCNETNDKKLKIKCSKRTITIDNPGKGKGKIKVYNALTGKIIHDMQFSADGQTIIQSNAPSGTYVIEGNNTTENVSVRVIIQ